MKLFTTLTSLTLASNPFSNIVECCRMLSSVKSLRALSITIDEEEAVAIPLLLPQLNVLNGNSVGVPGRRHSRSGQNQRKADAGVKGKEENALAFADIDLEKISDLFASVKLLYGNGQRLGASEDRRMTVAFDSHVDDVMGRLKERVSKLEQSYERRTEGLMAKHGMYDICFQEVLSFSEKTNAPLARVFRKIRSVHTSLFQLVPEIVKEVVEVQKEKNQDGIDQMTAELHRSEEETGQLLEAAEMLESEAKVRCRY